MKFCGNCGQPVIDGAEFCAHCGKPIDQCTATPYPNQQNFFQQPAKHDVPKCTACGHVGPWKLGPILRPIDWIIGILLLFAFGGGIVYLIVVAIIRSDPNRREKICPQCNARNLFTFFY